MYPFKVKCNTLDNLHLSMLSILVYRNCFYTKLQMQTVHWPAYFIFLTQQGTPVVLHFISLYLATTYRKSLSHFYLISSSFNSEIENVELSLRYFLKYEKEQRIARNRTRHLVYGALTHIKVSNHHSSLSEHQKSRETYHSILMQSLCISQWLT